MSKSCDCLQCRLRRIVLAETSSTSEAIDQLTIVIGRLLIGFDDEAVQTIAKGLRTTRDYYLSRRTGDTIGEVSGHA